MARPISCEDCSAFQQGHKWAFCAAECLHASLLEESAPFRENLYSSQCCIDRLSWHALSETGFWDPERSSGHIPKIPFLRTWQIRPERDRRLWRFVESEQPSAIRLSVRPVFARPCISQRRKGEAPSSINGLKRPEVSLETL